MSHQSGKGFYGKDLFVAQVKFVYETEFLLIELVSVGIAQLDKRHCC